MKALTFVHLRHLERLVGLYGETRVSEAIERAMKYRNFNVQAVARILQDRFPDVFPEPPVVPLLAGPAVMGALDDIESGSLENYDFDSMPPTASPGTAQGDSNDEETEQRQA